MLGLLSGTCSQAMLSLDECGDSMKSLWYCVVRKDFAVPGGLLHITSIRVFLNSWSATPEIQCPVLASVCGGDQTHQHQVLS